MRVVIFIRNYTFVFQPTTCKQTFLGLLFRPRFDIAIGTQCCSAGNWVRSGESAGQTALLQRNCLRILPSSCLARMIGCRFARFAPCQVGPTACVAVERGLFSFFFRRVWQRGVFSFQCALLLRLRAGCSARISCVCRMLPFAVDRAS